MPTEPPHGKKPVLALKRPCSSIKRSPFQTLGWTRLSSYVDAKSAMHLFVQVAMLRGHRQGDDELSSLEGERVTSEVGECDVLLDETSAAAAKRHAKRFVDGRSKSMRRQLCAAKAG